MITQEYLHSVLNYNPLTGIFTRKSGKIAGFTELKGYRSLKINYKSYKEHRLAWLYIYGEFPKNQIDHINGIKDDNRIQNLRLATASENMINRKIFKNSKSPYKGITFHKNQKKWTAKIQVNKKRLWLGSFNSAEDALLAYNEASKKYHGAFVYSEK